jgi:hypothetical protein
VLRKIVGRAAGRSARGAAPQTKRSVDPRSEVSIKRNDDRGRRGGARAVDEHGGQSTIDIVDEPVLAFDGTALEYWNQTGDVVRVTKELRRWCNNDRGRVEVRQPDQRSLVCAQLRIDRET